MAIRTATVAKTASDVNKPADGVIFDTLIASVIDAQIQAMSARGDVSTDSMYFDLRITKGIKELRQSDDSYILVDELVTALQARGYRVSPQILNPTRFKLTLAWG